jgi:hypothetical protein
MSCVEDRENEGLVQRHSRSHRQPISTVRVHVRIQPHVVVLPGPLVDIKRLQ